MGGRSMTKAIKLPSQSKLREDFTYNAATGDFTRYDGRWGHISVKGYIHIKYEGEIYNVHRLIWKWWYGYDPEQVDHINGDKIDNRIDNLRNVDNKTNCRNRTKQNNNTSGFTGVIWFEQTGKWRSQIKIDQRQIYIGSYDTPQEAKEARDEFIKEFYPNHFSERHGK